MQCAQNQYLWLKLAAKKCRINAVNFQWKSKFEGLLLLADVKYNVSFSFIGELSKIMPVAFFDSKNAKKSRFQELKHVTF